MRTALVTGANRGIGYEVSRQLENKGYFVFLACRGEDTGQKAVETLVSDGHRNVASLLLDVTRPDTIEDAAEEVGRRVTALDVLVNNAGILGARPADGGPVSIGEIQRVFDTNYFGVIRTTRAFLPLMRKSPEPRIVHVTSEIGSLSLQADPEWKYGRFKSPAYAPSKAALNMYTIVLAHELRDAPFKVNAVSPGYTATAFNGYRGEKRPEDAARVIVHYATLGPDGPTGGFFAEEGEVSW